jgi:hypothetical protein
MDRQSFDKANNGFYSCNKNQKFILAYKKVWQWTFFLGGKFKLPGRQRWLSDPGF